MCLPTTARPTARRKAARPRRLNPRLLLVIAATTYRLWPHSFDPTLESEERHVLQDPSGQVFSVYEQDMDFDAVRRLLAAGETPPRRWHCEACRAGDCVHVAALVDLGLL